MKKALGISIWVGMMVSFAALSPLVASAWNAHLRPFYVSRGVFTEYTARIQHFRIYRFDFAYLEMDCGGPEPRWATVLDLPEFDESAREFLARKFPECENIRHRSLMPDVGESWLVPWPA